MKISLLSVTTFILLLTCSIFSQSAREMGLDAYKNSEYYSAVQYLTTVTKTNPKDTEVWNILGMSYLKLSKFKDSHNAFNKAVKLDPQDAKLQVNLAYSSLVSNKLDNAEKEIKKALLLDPKNADAFYIRGLVYLWKGKFDNAISDADQSLSVEKDSIALYLLKSNAYLYKFGADIAKSGKFPEKIGLLQKSIESLEACLTSCSQNNLVIGKKSLDDLRAFYAYFDKKRGQPIESFIPNAKNGATIPTSANESTNDPTVNPLTILSKPRASYTDSARQAGIQGTIVLMVLFSADGVTRTIMVLKPLGNGLTEQAIKAAQQVKFNPQMKDGKPVSTVRMLQYNFILY